MTKHDASGPALGAAARHDGVVAWRLAQLLDAGFGRALAAELADTPGIDLHALLTLIDRGCPPELAVRLVEPFESSPGRG